MPKRPEGPETVLLALELLRRIPRNRKVTASELHAQLTAAGFHRDLRTIQRQLDTLTQHFDLERDERSKPYGYKWQEHAKGLSAPMLSEQDSLLLTLAEQHLKNLLPANLMKSMEAFFSQARTNLSSQEHAAREREWLSKVRVVATTQPLLPPTIKAGVFDEVSTALYANRWLRLSYKNATGKTSEAEVMPLGLAQQGERLYLVCRYQGHTNERSLALHRILSAEASTLTFERPPSFDLQAYDADGRFGIGCGRKIVLRFEIEKPAGLHLLESPLAVDQQVTELPDHYAITATLVETEQLDWWLKSFGDKIRNVSRDMLSNGI